MNATNMKRAIKKAVIMAIVLMVIFMGFAFAVMEAYASSEIDPGGNALDVKGHSTFYTEGRHWLFYLNDTTLVYTTSTNGSTFITETSIDTVHASYYGLHFDGSNVHLAWYNNTNIYYRCGTPQSGGSINWLQTTQTVITGVGSYVVYPTPSVDSGGYPFIVYADGIGNGETDLKAVHSSTNDGTWSTANSPTILESNGNGHLGSSAIISMSDRNMLLVWESPGPSPNPVKSSYYEHGVGWGTAVTIASDSVPFYMTATGYNGEAHVIYIEDDVDYKNVHKIYQESSDTWVTEDDDVVSDTFGIISIGEATGDLYFLYVDNVTFKDLYIMNWTSSGWGSGSFVETYPEGIEIVSSTAVVWSDMESSVIGHMVIVSDDWVNYLYFYDHVTASEIILAPPGVGGISEVCVTQDAHVVAAFPDITYGYENSIDAGYWVDGSISKLTFIGFNSGVDWDDITSALLVLRPTGRSYTTSFGLTLGFHHITTPWHQSTVTWNDAPSYASTPFTTYVVPSTGWDGAYIDITESLHRVCNGTSYGVAIVPYSGIAGSVIRYHSMETPSPPHAPRLLVNTWAQSYGTTFDRPRDIATDGEYLYVADTLNHRIVKLTMNLGFVAAYGSYGSGDGQFNRPYGIAVDDEYVYVVDYYNHRICKHNKTDLSYVAKIGTQGSGNDQFYYPTDVTTDGTYIYVADALNHRVVKRLASDLSYISEVGGEGDGNDEFRVPLSITMDALYIYVVDHHNGRIVIRSNVDAMTFVDVIDSWEGVSLEPTEIYRIDVNDDYLYFTYYSAESLGYFNVVKLRLSDGELMRYIGTMGLGVGELNYPDGVALHGQYIYVADRHNDRVVRFLDFAEFTSTPTTTVERTTYYSYTPTTDISATFELHGDASFLSLVGDEVTGLPTLSGSYSVNIKATTPLGAVSWQNYTLTVTSAHYPGSTTGGIDGYIVNQYDGSNNLLLTTVNNDTDYGFVGYNWIGGEDEEWERARTYISFNTSHIPDNAIIESVKIHLYMRQYSQTYPSTWLKGFTADYGMELTGDAWTSGSLEAETDYVFQYRGDMGVRGVYYELRPWQWYSLTVTPSAIDVGNFTQFEIVNAFSTFVQVALSSSSHPPYMTIDYYTPSESVIEVDGVDYNATFFPQIFDHNSTHKLYLIEFDTWTGVTNITLTKDSTWELESYWPIADSVTETDDQVEMIGLVEGVTYRLYFMVERAKITEYLIGTYDAATGIGFPFGTFLIEYSIGTTFDENDSYLVVGQTVELPASLAYSFAARDYFGNVIGTTTVHRDSSRSVGIPVFITDVYIDFSDGREHRFDIEYGGHVATFSASPIKLFQGLDYNITVYEDDYIYELTSTAFPAFSGASDRILITVVEKNVSATLHFRYYDATGTHPGQGIVWESFPLYIDGEFAPFPWLDTLMGSSHELVVLDYFGNELYNETVLASETSQLVQIPLNTYSFKVMNGLLDDPVRVQIHFNSTGTWVGPHSFYNGPGEVVERFFRSGDYRIQVTYYDSNGDAEGSVYFYYTVDDEPAYLLIRDGRIDRLMVNSQGILTYQRIITQMVTPDVVHIAENMPKVSAERIIKICPWSIVEAETESSQTNTTMSFWLPYPDDPLATITILRDILWLNGPYDTTIWVNTTAGANIYNSTTLPSRVNIGGQNITIEASNPITVTRDTKFRMETLFYFDYYTTQKKYQVTLTLNNSMSHLDMHNVKWFIGFPENISIDLTRVSVYDLNNDVMLEAGRHFDLTQSGIHMAFDLLNTTTNRSFRFVCYDLSVADDPRIPIITVSNVINEVYDSKEYFYIKATWINDNPRQYKGALQIKLAFEDGRYLDPSSIIIVDKNKNVVLSPTDFSYSGDVITINYIIADIGEVYTFDIYFEYDFVTKEGFNMWVPFFGGISIGIILVVITGILGLMATYSHMYTRKYPEELLACFLIALLMTIVLHIYSVGF